MAPEITVGWAQVGLAAGQFPADVVVDESWLVVVVDVADVAGLVEAVLEIVKS